MIQKEISRKKCRNHAAREAVARCPQCGRYFCRECVTEHEGKVLCAACLALPIHEAVSTRKYFPILVRAVQSVIGFLVLWMFFYYMGQVLLLIPTSFHEGTLWEKLD